MEPTVGGGALLLAAIEACSERHGMTNPPFGMTVKSSELEPGPPLIIPERLHNRSYLMTAVARTKAA